MLSLVAVIALQGPIPDGPALAQAIRARDAELFALYFDECDPDRLRTMLMPDFEMYHDRGGFVAPDAETFVQEYAGACTARQASGAWRSRRELVDASFDVHPVPGYGAIEDGEHLFYERRGDGPEQLVGRARFTQLWRLTDDGWRLSRLFSYAHTAAE